MVFDGLFGVPGNPIADLPTDRLDRAMALRNGLIALCEGRANMDDGVYRLLRREFMGDPATSALVPRFVRAAQDVGAMWAVLKDHSPQWAPRRQFVREQFAPLIDALEGVLVPAPAALPETAGHQVTRQAPDKPMYNLFVSGNEGAWDGSPWTVEASRCISGNEYTKDALVARFGALDDAAIEALIAMPCIFAYEAGHGRVPRFGAIREVTKRQGQVRVTYEFLPVDPFLSADDLQSMSFALDIGRWELNRTHWAVKEIDLAKELRSRGVVLPSHGAGMARTVDISTHSFEVALSFPGEVRPLVQEVVNHLERTLGTNSYFYDNNYVSQLARPSLDVFLQDIYRNRAKLIVVFLSADYQRKPWCGIELRAIRDIIAERRNERIMFIRTDDGQVEGVFATDGYVDARRFPAGEIARFIKQRVELL